MMKIYEPEPDNATRAKYDGSSFPFFFVWFILIFFGRKQFNKSVEAGYFHDDLTARQPHKALYNRLLYYLKLLRLGVSPILIRLISIGLSIYDWTPTPIKKLLKKLV